MNIFVTDFCPIKSAQVLPDKHIVKMPLETCQMLSIVASKKWGYGFGDLPRLDGTPYKTEKGAFRNHPCTIWAQQNWSWLIRHGLALCDEYTYRYGKTHSCEKTLLHAEMIFPFQYLRSVADHATVFARAMPDQWKYDDTIDDITAYKRYIASKPWVKDNYLRKPERKPDWI
mgnify:FL=1|tara:strand:- start:222 stop:737 length:516 start_codon:yes stop_codon:yes gene_type:complete